jgi:hypothetical protein
VTAWDDEGRPAAWTTIQDPEWDAEDRAIVQAVIDIRADQCHGCGEPLSESLHVEGQPDPIYSASYAVCVSCKAREHAQGLVEQRDAADEKNHVKVYRAARHWVMTRLK